MNGDVARAITRKIFAQKEGTKVMKRLGLLLLGLLIALPQRGEAQAVPGYTVTTIATIPGARGISIDDADNVYTLGRDSGELWEISPTGSARLVAKVGPTVGAGYVGPYFDKTSGTLLVSQHLAGDNVLQVTTSGAVSTFASGIVLAADITSDADGNIYVGDHNTDAVLKFAPGGSSLGAFATGLSNPDGLVFSPEGDLLVGNRGTGSIMRIPAVGGAAIEIPGSSIANPLGITIDSQGNIYAAGFSSGVLYKLLPSGGLPQEIGSGFNGPVGLAFDSNGDLYVAEFFGNRILKIEGVGPPVNQAPDVSAAAPSIASIWPPNNKMVDITINGVTDPDGDAVSITITGITNNETGTADASGIGTSTAQVKATRFGKGNGRTYTLSFTADDGKGGTASGSVTVTVAHDQGKSAKPAAVESSSWGEVKNLEQ